MEKSGAIPCSHKTHDRPLLDVPAEQHHGSIIINNYSMHDYIECLITPIIMPRTSLNTSFKKDDTTQHHNDRQKNDSKQNERQETAELTAELGLTFFFKDATLQQ